MAFSGDSERTKQPSGPLLVIGTDGRIAHVEPEAEAVLGWHRHELVGQPMERLLATPEEPPFTERLLRSTGSLDGPHLRTTLVRKDGVAIDMELAACTTVRDGADAIACSLRPLPEVPDSIEVPVGRDAPRGPARAIPGGGVGPTDRLFRVLFEQAPLGVFYFDELGVVTACNQELERIFTTRRDRVVGVHLLTHPDPRLVEGVRRVLRGEGFSFAGPYTAITSGRTVEVEVHLAPIVAPDGAVVGGTAMFSDITERRSAERERDATLARLETLLRSAPVGFALLDREGRFLQVNERMAAFNRLPPEEHIGRTPEEVIGRPGLVLRPLIDAVLSTGRSCERRHVSSEEVGASGPWRSWDASFYPVWENGSIAGVGVVVEEVTEHDRAERERNRLLAELQEAVQIRDDFLSVVSHELKTPLTPLAIWLGTMERRIRDDEPIDLPLVRKARTSLRKLTVLINDLLDVARINAGRFSVRRTPVRLDEVVRRSVSTLSESAPRPLHLDIAREGTEVAGDPARLEQVVDNLLDNAVKYSAPGDGIEVVLERRGDVVVLAVTDHGIGIPVEDQPLLFERYFQAKNASRRSVGGLGIGLYVCRDIIEQLGGRIWVRSKPGGGSTFYVALPALDAARRMLDAPDDHHETSSR